MSGGYYDYAYTKIQELSEQIAANAYAGDRYSDGRTSSVLRLAFSKHLELCARAAKAIEWNDSGDGDGDGEEGNLIRRCVDKSKVVGVALDIAEQAVRRLQAEIAQARKENP